MAAGQARAPPRDLEQRGCAERGRCSGPRLGAGAGTWAGGPGAPWQGRSQLTVDPPGAPGPRQSRAWVPLRGSPGQRAGARPGRLRAAAPWHLAALRSPPWRQRARGGPRAGVTPTPQAGAPSPAPSPSGSAHGPARAVGARPGPARRGGRQSGGSCRQSFPGDRSLLLESEPAGEGQHEAELQPLPGMGWDGTGAGCGAGQHLPSLGPGMSWSLRQGLVGVVGPGNSWLVPSCSFRMCRTTAVALKACCGAHSVSIGADQSPLRLPPAWSCPSTSTPARPAAPSASAPPHCTGRPLLDLPLPQG